MRCLTLAEVFRLLGHEVVFHCTAFPGGLNGLVVQLGFPINIIGKNTGPLSQLEDAAACSATTSDLLVIDCYRLDKTFETAMRGTTKQIMVIDDLANRDHDCDILLDQNAMPDAAKRYDNLVARDCLKLLGPEYAILRPEFYDYREELRERNSLRSLLVSYGGTDPENLTAIAIEAILNAKVPSLTADIVVGGNHRELTQIKQLCAPHPQLRLHIQTKEMARLMSEADLALGAGGSTHWERCFLGLGALITTVAENQIASSQYLDKLGCCRLLGDASTLTAAQLISEIESYAAEPQRLEEMSKRAISLIGPEEGTLKLIAAVIKATTGETL